MKLTLSFFALGILLTITGCTKEEVTLPAEESEKLCDTTAKATVHFMKVTETGEDDFFYLIIKDPISGQERIVFPSRLPDKLKAEGTQVEVAFSDTDRQYEFVICLEGHVLDPENPDVSTMPIIDVCSSNPVSS